MDNKLVDRRRYSAVILQHSAAEFERAVPELGKLLKGPRVQIETIKGWSLWSDRVFSGRLFYPRDVFPVGEAPEPRTGYAHPVYVAERQGRIRTLAVFTPFVGLLDRSFGAFPPSEETARYLAPDLPRLFEGLGSATNDTKDREILTLRSTKIGIQHNGDTDVQLVSLTGKNPLRSDLWKSVKRKYSPYSIRVHPVVNGETRNGPSVNFDRHGNVWLFATTPSTISESLKVLQSLTDTGMLKPVSENPLPKRSTIE
jgi:hypothetical protein